MKRLLVTTALAALIWAPALAQTDPAADYRYAAVGPGDTLESVARHNEITVQTLLQLNPDLRQNGGTLEGKSFVFVPQPHRVYHHARPKAAPAATEAAPAEASKTDKTDSKHEVVQVKPSKGHGLSEEEIDALYEDTVEPLARRHHVAPPPVVAMAPLPASQNVFINSEGQAMFVPTARPRPVAVHDEPETSPKHSLTSPRSLKAQSILKSALHFLTVPYVWGGQEPSGFDCSGFVQYVYRECGVSLPRTADLQYEIGERVTPGKEQPGDLVFFETYCPGASHVGIFLGRRQFVHASSSAGQVTISDLDDPKYQQVFLGSKRPW